MATLPETQTSPADEEIRTTELAYVAGLVDGEGTVTFNLRGDSRFIPNVRIANTNKAILEWAQTRLGGGICIQNHDKGGGAVWRLYWLGADCYRLLSLILPYLMIKDQQAQALLDFLESDSEYDQLLLVKSVCGLNRRPWTKCCKRVRELLAGYGE